MQRDDGESRRQRVLSPGALDDRQSEQHGIGKHRGKADSHRFSRRAAEGQARQRDREAETGDGAAVESSQHAGVKSAGEIEPVDCQKQQRRHGEADREGIQRIGDRAVEITGTNRAISRADQEEYRRNDEEDFSHCASACHNRTATGSRRAACF